MCRRLVIILRGFRMLIPVAFTAGTLASAQSVREVNCDQESLQEAVSASHPGDTLRVAGACRERVVVTIDRLTIDGQGNGVFDGGAPGGRPFGPGAGAFNAAIIIDGARGVVVRRLTIRNSLGGGIYGHSNAEFKVQNSTIQENYWGIVVQGSSHAEIENSEITGNTDVGLGITSTSSVAFRGSVKLNRNLEGISASGTCDLELLGAQLEASGNRSNGIALSGCSLNVRNFGSQSSILVRDNGADGLFIGGGQLVIGESFTFGFAGEIFHPIAATRNVGSGINLAGFASIVNLGGAKIELEGNATGLNLGSQSSLLTIGGLHAENNGTGLLADGAGTITLVSTPRNPSIIRGNNDADLDLRFGARMTVAGARIEKVKCDGTILSRGTTRCP